MRQALQQSASHQLLSDAARRGQHYDRHVTDVFVIEYTAQQLVGYIEVNIRNFVQGSQASAVPYIEAWYVEPEWRQQGLGKALLRHAEEWAKAQGYQELASNSLIQNHSSIDAHKALGFNEVERIVCFIKKL